MVKQVTRRALPLTAAVVLAGAGAAAISEAEPAKGVGAQLLARGTYSPFEVRTGSDSPIDLKVKSKAPMDLVVRRHAYDPHGSTGWHSHPGPVLITVTKGTLVFYEMDDPTCTPHVVSADPRVSPTNSYVDDGHGHIARNESDQPAEDVSVITAPVGGAFRKNLEIELSPCKGF